MGEWDRWLTKGEACRELGNAIVLQAVDDWKTAWKALQKKPNDTQMQNRMITSESFFKSDWYKALLDYPAEELMERLPEMAKQELYYDVTQKWIKAYITTRVLKPGKKTNDRRIDNAYKRMREAETEMRSKYFIRLYGKHPEEVIEDCRYKADTQIEDEEERKRQERIIQRRVEDYEKYNKPSRKK